jgi:hypothetical protein
MCRPFHLEIIMSELIEMNGSKVTIESDGPMHEDVCEHCLGGHFKDTGSTGECRIGPPYAGVTLVPRVNQLTGQVEPMMHAWSQFAPVERRTWCMAFEPREEGASQH